MTSSMSRTARTSAAVLVLTFVASFFIGANESASAAYVRPDAKSDTATLVVGQSVVVKPLGNDKVWKKAKARVKVLSASGVTVVKQGQAFTVTAPAPGTFKVRYRVTDKRGRYDNAAIKVTVKAKTIITTPPTPTPTPTPTATPTPTPTATATPTPTTAPDSLVSLINALPIATEVRDGYDRNTWKHWNTGLYADGCDTRAEVLRAEATAPIAAGTACPYTTTRSGGGQWFSYYDGVTTTDPSSFDIDHMVPLAEAHDSGAYAWTAAQKETYANDQGDSRSLVAVTANSNRSKSDQDPGEWWPLLERCRYAAEWTATKMRFGLTADQTEKDALLIQASQCGAMTVTYTKAW